MNTMTKQLSDLKKGDQVFVESCRRGGFDSIETIERVTKTQIVIAGNQKYRIEDGFQVGSGKWHETVIQPATPELIAQVKRKDEIMLAIRNARNLAAKVELMCRGSANAAAAIPHLKAALAALKNDPDNAA